MMEHARRLAQKYRSSGAVVDTNILLLYFVGAFDRSLILKFKRPQQFTVEDYDLLLNLLGYFDTIITTPHILTEVSNLSSQLGNGYFAKFRQAACVLKEQYVPITDILTMPEFPKFGLTDAGIMRIAKNNYLVITDDFRLSQYLQNVGIDTLNFNHIRMRLA